MTSSYALTSLQQTMYASASLIGCPWHYIEQIVVHLCDEEIQTDVMGAAWSELTKRHPALRNIVIAGDPSLPLQRTTPEVDIIPTEVDWLGHDAQEIDDALHAFLANDRAIGIDATNAPAFRIAIFQTGPAQSILVWTFPHSLLDGRAFAPLLDEVFQRYARLKSGGETVVSDVEPSDLFEQHCRALAQMSHDAGTAHFAETLNGWEGAEGLVDATTKPTRKVETALSLTAAQTKAIADLAHQNDVTSSTVVLAAWGAVMSRLTGQADIVFGNTRNGRHIIDGSHNAAGCFITTVPLRMQLDHKLTVGAALKQVRAEQIAVRPFEHTPLNTITRQLNIPPGRQIFDTVVMFDHGTLDEQLKAQSGDWQNRKVALFEEGDMPVSLAIYMGAQMRIVVEYDPAQVPNGAKLAGYVQQILIGLTGAKADTLLGAISMLDGATRQSMDALAGPELTISPDAKTCTDRFESAAARAPDHIALMQPDQTPVTYQALNKAADQLAGNLQAAGVKKGDTIGICMARGFGFITAILGIWKAGAAFVPMDPGYPTETLNIIAHDSGAALILADAYAPVLDAKTLDIAQLDTHAGPLTQTKRLGGDLAYVIFTSGTTGRPKGVMINHASLAAHADAIVPLFDLTPQDRVLQFAALSFDVALEEIIPTLVSGATLVLRSDAMAQSVPEFLGQVETLGVTVTNLPTGFWVALTDVLDTHDHPFPPFIRLLIVGGERVPLSTLKRWQQRLPDLRWLNGYGPTETTITCTTHEASLRDLAGDTVPIGRPLSHARAWVLAPDGGLAPEGVEGALFISGPAVADGYINNPDRTAASFSQAIFDPEVGRMYGTGDRVMWRNGVLHYLGRMDRQIKLRGFRIEPGQIEAALEALDNIDRAHAEVLSIGNGTPQLVAWYSAPTGAVPSSPQDVQSALAKDLPPQMRPLPVPITEWPQTPGGKIDVARLPIPDIGLQPDDTSEGVQSPLVQKVASLFEHILKVENVGPATSFFDAGGDSLSLLRLMSELESAFDTQLEPTALYNDPTPRGVVRALQDQDSDPLVVIPVQPEGSAPPLYAVHVLGDNGSYFRPLAKVMGKEQPVFGLTVGLLTADTPTSVQDIADFYVQQIERHHPKGPLSLVAVSAGSYVTLELAQKLQKAGRDVQALILLDAEGPDGRARVGRVRRVAVHLGEILRHGWPYIRAQLMARREANAQDAAHQRLQGADGPDGDVSAVDIGGVEDFVAANMIAIEAYNPQPYTRCLTIYRAGHDQFDSKRALETGLGWSSIAAGGFDLTDVPGDHLGILDEPNVQTLGAHIKAVLDALNRKGS
jgi:amino acid adenylation domain-containing protein